MSDGFHFGGDYHLKMVKMVTFVMYILAQLKKNTIGPDGLTAGFYLTQFSCYLSHSRL